MALFPFFLGLPFTMMILFVIGFLLF